jgi:hypothetical protein
MPSPSLTSPNTGNYVVGKGIVTFKREGEADFVDMGNCSAMEFTPGITFLDHFSSREGVKTKDLSIVLEKTGEIVITLDEWTSSNLALALLGTKNDAAVGGPTVDIFSANTINGELKYTATNDVGPKWDLWFYNVSIKPSGKIGPISGEFGQLEITADVLVAGADDSAHAGEIGIAQLTNLP